MSDLKVISNEELLCETEKAVAQERLSTTEVIQHFQEISDRKLYLDRGFPSLYEMVTKHFGYCAGSAMRRINSMRLVRDLPEIEAKIETGTLSLTAAANFQSFFYQEARESRSYSREEKIELLESCLNKSTRDVERELCKRSPDREKRESSRHISDDRIRVSFTISAELERKLEKLKQLLSHVDPNLSTEALIGRLAEIGLDKYDPARKAVRTEKRKPFSASPPAPEVDRQRSRYIRTSEVSEVKRVNDENGCEFVDHKTGRRCGSKHFLQMDHVIPFSHGGSSDADNLRIYCAAHNQWVWKNRYDTRVRADHRMYA